MITSLAETNSEHYLYESELTFGMEFGNKILNLYKESPEVFIPRQNYSRLTDPKSLIRQVGKEKTKELYRRSQIVKQQHNNGTSIEFSQKYLTDELTEEFISLMPDWLKSASPGEPTPILQVSKSGEFLPPHKGHKRKSSLFLLLQGNNQETRWYENTEDFEVMDCLRIPDPDKIRPVVSAVMQPWKWYVFNHFEWHSVHGFKNGNIRINIGLDFNNIDADQLVQLIKDNNGK